MQCNTSADDWGDYNSSPCTSYRLAKNAPLLQGKDDWKVHDKQFGHMMSRDIRLFRMGVLSITLCPALAQIHSS